MLEMLEALDPFVGARNHMLSLAQSIALPEDQFLYLSAIVFGLPAGFLVRFIPTSMPQLRNAYVAVVGFALSLYCFRGTALLGVAFMLACYGLLAFMGGRSPFKFFFAVLSLGIMGHIVKMQYNYGNFLIDFQSPLLLIIIKITYIGWNVYDGLPQKRNKLSHSQADTAIQGLPSLPEYLGHMFFFGNFFAGPVVEFQEYRRWIYGEREFQKPPPFCSTLHASGIALLKAMIAIVAVLFFINKYFPFHSIFCCGATYGSAPCNASTTCSPHQLSDWFQALSWPARSLFVAVACGLARTSFYFVWYLDEAICNLCGIGYRGGGEFGRCSHGSWLGVEFAHSMPEVLRNWNVGANTWLRRCVYERLQQELKMQPKSSNLITMLASAGWHGVYIGHWLTFFGAFLQSELSNMARAAFRPLFQRKKVAVEVFHLRVQAKLGDVNAKKKIRQLDVPVSMPIWYNALGVAFTSLLLNLAASPFLTLDFGDTMAMLASTNYIGYIVPTFLYGMCYGINMFVTRPKVRKIAMSANSSTKNGADLAKANQQMAKPAKSD